MKYCPSCHKKLCFKDLWIYGFKGTDHVINCPHCGSELKPAKPPVNLSGSVFRGFMSVLIPFNIYIYYVEMNFIKGVLACMPIVIFVVIIEFALMYHNIKLITNK